jgi:hypothetical protein
MHAKPPSRNESVLRAGRTRIRSASWDRVETSLFDRLRWRWWLCLGGGGGCDVASGGPMRRNSITDIGQRRHAAVATANIVIDAAAFEVHCAHNHNLKMTANGDRQPI